MTNYTIHYPEYGVTQEKVLIPHSIYTQYMSIPYETKEEQSIAKGWLKKQTGGKEWFTDKSPIYEAITTGIINCNGQHKVIIT